MNTISQAAAFAKRPLSVSALTQSGLRSTHVALPSSTVTLTKLFHHVKEQTSTESRVFLCVQKYVHSCL